MNSGEFVAGEEELGEYEPIERRKGCFASPMGPAHTNIKRFDSAQPVSLFLSLRNLN